MVSTFTPNIQLEEPARGDYVGTWDTPVNANMTELDLTIGGFTTISGAAGSVVLAAAQFQCNMIVFNSTLLANITITFPASVTKPYSIFNTCTGSSLFTITLQTTVAGSRVICAPPGESVDIMNFGNGNLYYKNLGLVGSFWDYGGSSVPAWVSGCTIPPFLNCDGTAVSSVTYPILYGMIGATLPDIRGTARAALNQGTGRMSSANGGVDGNTNFTRGGADSITLATSQIPAHTHANTLTDPGHFHNASVVSDGTGGSAQQTIGAGGLAMNNRTATATTGITITNVSAGGGALHSNMQPTTVAGLCLIRAA